MHCYITCKGEGLDPQKLIISYFNGKLDFPFVDEVKEDDQKFFGIIFYAFHKNSGGGNKGDRTNKKWGQLDAHNLLLLTFCILPLPSLVNIL